MQRSEAVCEAVFACLGMQHHESVKLGIIPLSHPSWTEVGIKITVSAEPRCWCEWWTSLNWTTFLSLLLCVSQRGEIYVSEASSPLWDRGTCIQLCGLLWCDQPWSHPVMQWDTAQWELPFPLWPARSLLGFFTFTVLVKHLPLTSTLICWQWHVSGFFTPLRQ